MGIRINRDGRPTNVRTDRQTSHRQRNNTKRQYHLLRPTTIPSPRPRPPQPPLLPTCNTPHAWLLNISTHSQLPSEKDEDTANAKDNRHRHHHTGNINTTKEHTQHPPITKTRLPNADFVLAPISSTAIFEVNLPVRITQWM